MMNRPYKILVVDDSLLWCEQIQELLVEAGFDVLIAHDRDSVMKKVKQNEFDVLVVDINLNDSSKNIDGLLINNYIQRNHIKSHVILMSARSISTQVHKSIGQATFIEKSDLSRHPFSIVDAVNNALRTPLKYDTQEMSNDETSSNCRG